MTAQALWAVGPRRSRRCSSRRRASRSPTAPALVDHTIDTLIAGLKTPAPAAPRTAVPPKSKKWDFID